MNELQSFIKVYFDLIHVILGISSTIRMIIYYLLNTCLIVNSIYIHIGSQILIFIVNPLIGN